VTLSHVGPDGGARMVDVGEKAITRREAVAEGCVRMSPEAFALVESNTLAKGDVLGTARIAGIQGAKRTAELIPLCHPLALDRIDVVATLEKEVPGVRVTATTSVEAKTGVEMEALVAVTVACLTVYDMVKAADRAMTIEAVRLVHKSGGRSGDYSARSPSV
jgi:cyclic pyranopterin phosphate synthase